MQNILIAFYGTHFSFIIGLIRGVYFASQIIAENNGLKLRSKSIYIISVVIAGCVIVVIVDFSAEKPNESCPIGCKAFLAAILSRDPDPVRENKSPRRL